MNGKARTARLYGIAGIITFLVMGFQLFSYYFMGAKSISLFADTFHAGSDGIVLFGTTYLLMRAVTLSRKELLLHRYFTYLNIALLFLGVVLACEETYRHIGDVVTPSWNVLIVAAIGGFGDWCVKRLLQTVDTEELPQSLRTNHKANVLHITQDFWTSLVVIVSGVAIRFGFPELDYILGSLITIIILWEGIGLLYEEWSGKHFPFHLHHHTDEHCDHHH